MNQIANTQVASSEESNMASVNMKLNDKILNALRLKPGSTNK